MKVNLSTFVLFIFFFCANSFAYNIKSYGDIPKGPRLNLVFCSLHYYNQKVFLEDTEILVQRLRQTGPFDEFTEEIGLYYIDFSRKEENLIFKRAQAFPPLKVRQDFLNGISIHLKPNYKLVIIDAVDSISCAELSSANKPSLVILGKRRYKDKNSFAKGFLHELGHSLGLRDECVDCGEICPPGPPNCATTKEEAIEWWGDLVGKESRVNYISGCCGNKDYIRPVIASLMNDPDRAEDFGPINERYLRDALVEIKK